MLKKYENDAKEGWGSRKQKWFVHLDSAGYPTIAYGHLVGKGEDFGAGINAGEGHYLGTATKQLCGDVT